MYRAKTNESTRAPEDVYAEATEFIALYRPSLAGGHRSNPALFFVSPVEDIGVERDEDDSREEDDRQH